MNGHNAGWLGGVCAEIARRLGWSTLGVRIAMVLALLVWPVFTIAAYLLATWVLGRERSGQAAPEAPPKPAGDEWDQRLADFDRRLGH